MRNKSNKLPCICIRCGQKKTELHFYYGYSTELSLRMEGPFGLDFFRPTLRTLNQQLRDNKDIYSILTSEEYGQPTITYCTDNLSLFTYYSQIINSLRAFIFEHHFIPEYLLLYRLGKYRSFCEYLDYLHYVLDTYDEAETPLAYLYHLCESEGYPTPKELRRLLYQIAVRAREEPERSYIKCIKKEMRLHKDNLKARLKACAIAADKFERSIFHWTPVAIEEPREKKDPMPEPLRRRMTDAAKARGLPASFYESL